MEAKENHPTIQKILKILILLVGAVIFWFSFKEIFNGKIRFVGILHVATLLAYPVAVLWEYLKGKGIINGAIQLCTLGYFVGMKLANHISEVNFSTSLYSGFNFQPTFFPYIFILFLLHTLGPNLIRRL
jgi:hypothetical protein